MDIKIRMGLQEKKKFCYFKKKSLFKNNISIDFVFNKKIGE